jgi:hypothetical protein
MSAPSNAKRVQTSIVIPRPLRDRIDRHAKQHDTNMATILRMAALEYLVRHEQKGTVEVE